MLTHFIKIMEIQSGLRKEERKKAERNKAEADFALGITPFVAAKPYSPKTASLQMRKPDGICHSLLITVLEEGFSLF